VGIDGLFCEIHEDPERALSDGPNSLYLDTLRPLVRDVLAIQAAWQKEGGEAAETTPPPATGG
jgi:2-dehydro-3-deoxyphosphooctonate aldolase (KDO 8-P synthase)